MKTKKVPKLIILLIIFITVFFLIRKTNNENWPNKEIPDFMSKSISEALPKIREFYDAYGFNYKEHSTNGKYMLDRGGICRESRDKPLDENGITMLR